MTQPRTSEFALDGALHLSGHGFDIRRNIILPSGSQPFDIPAERGQRRLQPMREVRGMILRPGKRGTLLLQQGIDLRNQRRDLDWRGFGQAIGVS